MSFARIAITLPKEVLAATDRRAKELDRSRSRVVVDALRAYLATPAVVREPAQPAYGSDAYGVARLEQLERDLAKSPAERLHAAEQAARLAASVRRGPSPGRRHQIIGFDSYEDFYEWKKAGGP
jgi:hypothetical protein